MIIDLGRADSPQSLCMTVLADHKAIKKPSSGSFKIAQNLLHFSLTLLAVTENYQLSIM